MFDRPFVLLGGGGHAKVVLDVLHSLGATVRGVCDPALADRQGERWMGIEVLGDDDQLHVVAPTEVYLANGVGMMPGSGLRQRLFEEMTSAGYEFPALIHPSASVSGKARIEVGAQIMRGSVVQACAEVGCNTIVNSSAIVDHDSRIGAHCHVAPGVTICGDVTVQQGAFIGAGTTVIQEVAIGAGAIVGAGSLLLQDVAGASIYHSGRKARSANRSVSRGT